MSPFCWNSKVLHITRCLQEDGAIVSTIVEECFSVEVTQNERIALMNNTPPKSCVSVDFIYFKS